MHLRSCFYLSLISIFLLFSTTSALPRTELDSPRQGRWIWDWLKLGELFGTCMGEYKLCGESSKNGKDCCNDWVCRRSLTDNCFYCMENLNIPYVGNVGGVGVGIGADYYYPGTGYIQPMY